MRNRFVVFLGLVVAVALFIAAGAQAAPIKVPPINTTSSAPAATNPSNATDGQPSTRWESGAMPTQWIQLDLGRTVSLQKIRLLPYMTKASSTTQQIYVGQTDPPTKLLTTVSRLTQDGQWIEIATPQWLSAGGVRYIRITTTASNVRVAWREIEAIQGVEYFGYFCDSCLNPENDMQSPAAAGANVHMIERPDSPTTGKFDPASWLPAIQQAQALNGKVIMFVTNQLFVGNRLRSDWQEQVTAILNFIKNTAPANSVAAIYLYDEPYNWGVPSADLQAAADKIHADSLSLLGAKMPVAAFFRVTEVDCGPTSCPKSMFDWIGFDCYAPWGNCGNAVMDHWIDKLRSELVPGQRLMLAPPAYHGDFNELPTVQDILTDINYWHLQVIKDPAYIAVIPFRFGVMAERAVQYRMLQFAADMTNPGNKTVHAVFQDASAWIPGGEPFLAFDDDYTVDGWNSGGLQPQSIVGSFGGSTRVNKIVLRVSQNPNGQTVHTLNGYRVGTGWTALTPFTGSGITHEGQELTWTGSADITQISVVTTSSPSWVAWHDIRITRN